MKYWEFIPDGVNFKAIDLMSDSNQLRSPRTVEAFEYYLREVQTVYTIPETMENPACDFPHLAIGTMLPVFSTRAFNLLMPLVEKDVRVAPLNWLNEQHESLHAVFVARVVNCLDEAQSEVQYFNDGRIMGVSKAKFHNEKLFNTHMFRLYGLQYSPVYISDEFVQVAHAAGLSGLYPAEP